MSYMHIENLYKNRTIMMFRECYALEKLHGTSSFLSWSGSSLSFMSGGEKHDKFVALFDQEKLVELFKANFGEQKVVVFGEAYGGKQQAMSHTYGPTLKFIGFEVKVEETWLAVPNAHDVCNKLGLDFVHYEKGPTEIAWLDAQRDADSVQAIRNGMGTGKKREGIVLRPLVEVRLSNGARVISKHKREDFQETKTKRDMSVNPEQLAILEKAEEIANEWVTEMRLTHVLDKFPNASMEQMPEVIKAMVEDVTREASGEIIDSKEARKAIGKKTVELFKNRLKNSLHNGE